DDVAAVLAVHALGPGSHNVGVRPLSAHMGVYHDEIRRLRRRRHQVLDVPQVRQPVRVGVGSEADHGHGGATDVRAGDLVACADGADVVSGQVGLGVGVSGRPEVAGVVVGQIQQVEAGEVLRSPGGATERQAVATGVTFDVSGVLGDHLFQVGRHQVLGEPVFDVREVAGAAIVGDGVPDVMDQHITGAPDADLSGHAGRLTRER